MEAVKSSRKNKIKEARNFKTCLNFKVGSTTELILLVLSQIAFQVSHLIIRNCSSKSPQLIS